MKRFLLLILLANCSALYSQTEFFSDSIFIQQNKIKKIIHYQCSPKDLYFKTKSSSYSIREYNRDGLLVKQTNYSQGELQSTDQNEYNLKKQLVKKISNSSFNNATIIYTYNDKDEPVSIEYKRQNYGDYKYLFEYENGKKVKQSVYSNGKRDGMETYTYKNGRLNTVWYYSANADTAYMKLLLHYDSDGNETWREVKLGPGNFYPKKEYDAKGRLSMITYVDYEGKKITGKEYYTWQNDLLVKKKLEMLQEEKQTIEINCTYENGLLVEHDYNSDLLRNKTNAVYTYNPGGLLTSITHYVNEKVTHKFAYTYNDKKQLVKTYHGWPQGNQYSTTIVDPKKVKSKEEEKLSGYSTFYTYDEKGDTLQRKTVQDTNYFVGKFGWTYGSPYPSATIFDYKERKEFSVQQGKKDPGTHFQYGPLMRNMAEPSLDWKRHEQVYPISFDIIDTLKNTVKNGAGELILKLQPFNAYALKAKQIVIRTITYASAKVFTATDKDSASTIITKLEVNDTNFVRTSLNTQTIIKGNEQLIYDYRSGYRAELVMKLKFDQQNSLVSKTILYPSTEQETTFDYSDPLEVKETDVYKSGFSQIKVHVYNKQGQEIKFIRFDHNGQISEQKVYSFKDGLCEGFYSNMPAARYTDRYEYEFFE